LKLSLANSTSSHALSFGPILAPDWASSAARDEDTSVRELPPEMARIRAKKAPTWRLGRERKVVSGRWEKGGGSGKGGGVERGREGEVGGKREERRVKGDKKGGGRGGR
jgi:hypothetical protein